MSEALPVAIVGAGVVGLTTAVVLIEHGGYAPVIFSSNRTSNTTSSVGAAVWFPYDAEPEPLVAAWGLLSYGRFAELARVPDTGVSMIDFEYRSAHDDVHVPEWAESIGYRRLQPSKDSPYLSAFQVRVPLMDTTRYLRYLEKRTKLTDELFRCVSLNALTEIPADFPVVVNCSGYGARALVVDDEMIAHRGQVAVVEKLAHVPAFALDKPLTYVIPRENDCVFGGVNETSEDIAPNHELTREIVARCSKMLNLQRSPSVLAEPVGIRPARKAGVRLQAERLGDGRLVVHNYGHGGCGVSLSWGCAQKVLQLVETFR
ncbi:MAG TPA: FAD-dependent oxidoreductase [Thermoanaerobaculia bacterium]|nr:FAD-dependent oxidoreductase [Thermoanaerobaculia bacterium]